MAKATYKISNVAYLPALPGTRMIIYRSRFMVVDADDSNDPAIHQVETPVVAWEIRRNNFDDVWANPVSSQIRDEGDDWAIVYPDGQIEFNAFYDETEFTGKTLEEFAAFCDAETRKMVRECRCMDCGKDLRGSMSPDSDSPMLRNEVWRSIVPDVHGRLCRAHMEQRLGRELTASDMMKRPK